MPRTTVFPTTRPRRPTNLGPLVLLAVVFAPGCTSVLSTASLQEMLWTGDRHAAESAAEIADDGPQPTPDESAEEPEEQATDEARRAAAIDEAVSRLARLGHLDEAARASLLATLERTEQEDWPAVVEAFAESLPAVDPASSEVQPDRSIAAETPAAVDPPAAPPVHVVAKADLDAPADAADHGPAPVADEPPPPASAAAPSAPAAASEVAAALAAPEPTVPAAEPAAPPEPPAAPDATTPAATGLAINNAAFASRVQGWGVLERFTDERFPPGQDVIVYFELDGLSAGESAAGHTTCIDTTLRLVDAEGTLVHQWSFEPIAETCRARRRDYFARYVVTIPETAVPGPHRVELVVTDTLSGQVARSEMPLDILPTADPAD